MICRITVTSAADRRIECLVIRKDRLCRSLLTVAIIRSRIGRIAGPHLCQYLAGVGTQIDLLAALPDVCNSVFKGGSQSKLASLDEESALKIARHLDERYARQHSNH